MQHPNLPSADRPALEARRDQAIRLLYDSRKVAPKLQETHRRAIGDGFAAAGLTAPDFSRLSRAEALARVRALDQAMRRWLCKLACGVTALLLLGPVPPARASETQPGCSRIIEDALRKVEGVPPSRRAAVALAGLAGATCLDALAGAAGAAARLKRPARDRALARAAAPELPASCLAKDPNASALTVSEHCPAPRDLAPSPAALRDLDAGTYLFVVAAHAKLSASRGLTTDAVRLLNNLLLGAALEGEAARR